MWMGAGYVEVDFVRAAVMLKSADALEIIHMELCAPTDGGSLRSVFIDRTGQVPPLYLSHLPSMFFICVTCEAVITRIYLWLTAS